MAITPHSLDINQLGHFTLAGLDICDLANKYGTPLYIMDMETLRANCKTYTSSMAQAYPNSRIVYAGKANLNRAVLKVLAEENVGLDVVSGGELYSALHSPLDKSTIIFHGNNKSKIELKLAIDHDILIVIDNFQELINIERISNELNRDVRVLIRLKPEIKVDTHKHIQTGQSTSKFGFNLDEIPEIMKKICQSKYIKYLGLHGHLGSQIFDADPYMRLIETMIDEIVAIKQKFNLETKVLNIGGGMGIQYIESESSIDTSSFITKVCEYVSIVCKRSHIDLPELIMEPGRSLIGNAGITLYSIGAIKQIKDLKTYIFVDGGMADNPRPIMYEAKYSLAVANKANQSATQSYCVAGKFCESGDIIADDIKLPSVEVGDWLVVFGTGAYNYSMASNYNKSCKPAMIAIENNHDRLIIKRETFEDLIRLELE